jgi:hypothetical protein
MREFRTSGSVRGALSNERPYRERCYFTGQLRLFLSSIRIRHGIEEPADDGE